ncbi:unnamed protein product [Candidula unifasciata]|uniref:LRRCT domain-containing protein n=1 Tax=Candidula unifasciata TaxID=100452 RepID=A0A8S3ZP45_9EUPU|nr:unnamed protein product [Candidula unifasciata]
MESYVPYAMLVTCVGIVQSVERGFVYCPAYPCTCESKDGGLIVNCMSLYLTALPKFLSFEGRIKELSLRHNSINSLPAGGFKHLHIEKLDLRDNAINFIHTTAFTGLEHTLRWLSIQLYAMDGFPTDPLSRLSRLRTLIILGCKEQDLRPSLFLNLGSMEELHLIGCRINRIQPGTFLALPFLTSLVLSQNSLGFQNIAEINVLDKLVCLDLSYNDVHYLKSFAFFKLSKLRSLKLGYNKLRYVEDNTFSNLEFSLEGLDLQNNNLQEQHLLSLADLKVLRRLDLSFNSISDLSGEYFATMRYLTNLQLAHNNIRVIEAGSFRRLWSVRDLDLSGNPLQLIENGAFSETNVLETLNISDSKIGGSINGRTFEDLTSSLSRLVAKNASLINADIRALCHLTNLTYLDVSHNWVDHLDLNFMAGMENVKHANFSHNNISSFENKYSQARDISLEFLDLSWNKILVINNCVLLPLKKLRDIRLEGNPLTCNCSLAWLYRWQQVSQLNHPQNDYKWTCRSPHSLRGFYFSELEFSDLRCPQPPGSEEVCPTTGNKTWGLGSTTAAVGKLQDTHTWGHISVNISRGNSSSATVTWTVDDFQPMYGFNITLKRHNDTTALQSAAVADGVSNYTLQLNETFKQNICVTAINKEGLQSAEACLEVPIFQHEHDESSETRLNNLIQNSFIPLTFIYISGSMAIVFIAACVVVFVRGKRKLPRRVKPLGVAYPAWLDHRTSVASSSMTHDPHFLNTLFVDSSGTLRSIIDNMSTLRTTVSNQEVTQSANEHPGTAQSTIDHAGVPTTTNDPNQGTMLNDVSGPTVQNPEANLPLDSPFTLSSRRESGVDNKEASQDASLVHGLIEIRPRRSDASNEFFFHF